MTEQSHADHAVENGIDLADVRLLVDDFATALAFYRDVVGLRPRVHVEGVYAEFAAGRATLAIYRRDLMAEIVADLSPHANDDRVLFTFDVDDLEATFERLQAGGATVVNPPHDQPVWEIRVAHLRDPAGNLFELDQRR